MKKYFFGLMFFLSSFIVSRAITLEEALDILNDKTVTNFSFFIPENQISDAGALALAKAIKMNKTITTLEFGWDRRGIQYLIKAIERNTTITKLVLYLDRTLVGDEGAQALAKAIENNNTITNLTLILIDSFIGNEGTQYLANAIKKNKTITSLKLNLDSNRIGDAGAQYLADAIKKNKTITSLKLNLDSNEIGDAGAQALVDAIERHETITDIELNLSDNQIGFVTSRVIRQVIRRIHRKFERFKECFWKLFNNGEFSDAEIRGIQVHKKIMTARLGDEVYGNLGTILEDRDLDDVKAFIRWVYTGFVETNKQEIVRQICDRLGINFEEKNGIDGFRRDMQRLYDSRDKTGDFTINVQKTKFKAHKAVLIARSGFFKGMFTAAVGEDVTDKSGATTEEFEQLLEYIYTAREPELATPEDLEFWKELKEYYQVNKFI